MPGTVIGTSMNNGYPGTFARNGDCVVKSYLVLSTDSAGPAFGAAVVLNQDSTGGTISDAAVAKAAGHTPVMTQGANFAFVGFAIREVFTLLPTSFAAQPQVPAIQAYAPGQPCDVLERGSIVVIVKDPQAAGYKAGQSVFLRTVLNGAFPSAKVGDLETAADGGNTVQLTNVYMSTGVADANSVVEVTVLNRNTP
jgi:hypothetical protein